MMNLKRKFALTIGGTAIMALAVLSAACGGSSIRLCTETAPNGLNNNVSYAEVFNGAAEQSPVCEISGSYLEPDEKYQFSGGLLIIDGNIPRNASVTVKEGKLYVDGDVLDGAKAKASVSEERESYIIMVPVYNAATETTTMTPQTHWRFEGFTYEGDTDPAVIISGSVLRNAEVKSNHGIYAGSVGYIDINGDGAKLKTGHDTKVTIGGTMPDFFITPLVP